MRELTLNEALITVGGALNNGYNFSYIVESTVSGAILGFVGAIFYGTPETNMVFLVGGPMLGATYATAMMVASVIDSYAFAATPAH